MTKPTNVNRKEGEVDDESDRYSRGNKVIEKVVMEKIYGSERRFQS